MRSFFGFIPSEQLMNTIQQAQAQMNQNDKTPLYPARDKIVEGINKELVDNLLVKLVEFLPPSDKKDTMTKLANFIQGSVRTLVGQLLSKVDNEQAKKSIVFIENSMAKDSAGIKRIGFAIPESLMAQMQASFAEVEAGRGKEQRAAIAEQFKLFVDLLLKHYMDDFNKTLDLGMIKGKLANVTKSGVSKALHVAIDKLIPSLHQQELAQFTQHYGAMMFKTED